jgi:hypothetical protein
LLAFIPWMASTIEDELLGLRKRVQYSLLNSVCFLLWQFWRLMNLKLCCWNTLWNLNEVCFSYIFFCGNSLRINVSNIAVLKRHNDLSKYVKRYWMCVYILYTTWLFTIICLQFVYLIVIYLIRSKLYIMKVTVALFLYRVRWWYGNCNKLSDTLL